VHDKAESPIGYQLEDRARKAKIPRRSKMSRDELIEALSEAA
jgi:hypothetical protein